MIYNQEVCGLKAVSRAKGRINFLPTTPGGRPFSLSDAGYAVHMQKHTINIPRLRVDYTAKERDLVLGTRNHRALSEWLICLLLGWVPDQKNLSIVYSVMRTTNWTRLPSGVWHRAITATPGYIKYPGRNSLLEKTPPQGHVYDPRYLPPQHTPTAIVLNATPDPIEARVAWAKDKAAHARKVQDAALANIQQQALQLQKTLVAFAAEAGSKASRNVVARAFGDVVEKEPHPACDEFFKTAAALHELSR